MIWKRMLSGALCSEEEHVLLVVVELDRLLVVLPERLLVGLQERLLEVQLVLQLEVQPVLQLAQLHQEDLQCCQEHVKVFHKELPQ